MYLCLYLDIAFYKSQSSSVYVCFIDASKEFDKNKIYRGMPDVFVRLLYYCYRTKMLVSDGAHIVQKCLL